MDRRTFAKSLTAGALGGFFRPWNSPVWAQAAQARTPPALARAGAALPKAIVTKIRVLTPNRVQSKQHYGGVQPQQHGHPG